MSRYEIGYLHARRDIKPTGGKHAVKVVYANSASEAAECLEDKGYEIVSMKKLKDKPLEPISLLNEAIDRTIFNVCQEPYPRKN